MGERLQRRLVNISGGLIILGLITAACENDSSIATLNPASISSPRPERSPTLTPTDGPTLVVVTAGPVIRRGTPEIFSAINIPATVIERSHRDATLTALPTPARSIPRRADRS